MITNNKIKQLNALRDKSKARREEGVFIVEGFKMCEEAPKELVLETYATDRFVASHKEWCKANNVEVVDEKTFDRLSDTKTPQGILSVVKQAEYTVEDIISKGNLFVILEDIQDPGNMGTIMRTAEGAGVSGIIMTRGCVDIYNPKTIRSTMGSVYRVPFVYTDNIGETIGAMKAAGIEIFAAHLKGEKYYDEIKYGRAAFLIGNEGNGLRDETADMADTYIKIPMQGKVESLNAAVATSILMYEHSRQMRV